MSEFNRPEARIGTDEWVAEAERRSERYAGRLGAARRFFDRIPAGGRLALFVVPAAIFPLTTENDFYVRVGVNTLLFALLALGLNIVVGYAGLLDLGYVAFYGFGAYTYALLASNQFDLHWPTEAIIPLVIVASALLGLVLGLTSRRLFGDYLAIVTLFFAQIFVVVVSNANRITPPWREGPVDITGGPNGIASVDPMSIFGFDLRSVTHYFYFALIVFTLIISGLYFLSESRTGRAWKALREDALAAEALGMPVKRLKLLAFAFGAATAGLTGTILAAVQLGVYPTNFDIPLLITIYAMVILGGAGSLGGVVIGAILITVVFEVLEQPEDARLVFYAVILATLLVLLRPWKRLAAVLAATVAIGFALRLLADAVWPRGTARALEDASAVASVIERWVLLPSNPEYIGDFAFVALVAAVIALTRLRGLARTIALAPVLYLAVFVWENRLAEDPAVTRLLLLGALLIALMNARPQGLFGTSRVEIV